MSPTDADSQEKKLLEISKRECKPIKIFGLVRIEKDIKSASSMIHQALPGGIEVLVLVPPIKRLLLPGEKSTAKSEDMHAAFEWCRRVIECTLPYLNKVEHGGKILNVVPAIALKPNPNMPLECGMVRNLIGYSHSIAKAAAKHWTTLNTLSIGPLAMDLPDDISLQDKTRLLEHNIIKDFCSEIYLSGALFFFAAGGNSYITGQVLAIDGGYNLQYGN